MSEVIYEIKTEALKDFTYKKPLVSIDKNGEPQVVYSKDKDAHVHIKEIVFLNLVGYEKVEKRGKSGESLVINKGKLTSYEPLDCANQYILSKHVLDEKEESKQSSKALTHYFSFVLAAQAAWDRRYDNDSHDSYIDPPRPAWNKFGVRKNQRITYMYHKSIERGAIDGTGLAKTTATAYMREVVNFYKYHLKLGMRFNNSPFEYEEVLISIDNSGTDMRSHKTKAIQTTDLRLKFSKSRKNNGGSLPTSRRDLKPLTNAEWLEINKILTTLKKVIKNVKGDDKWVSLPEEYCLLFRIYRYTGLRKEEGASLHLNQIIPPNMAKPMLRLGVGNQYGSLTKDPKGGYHNKNRQTIIPSSLMLDLYNYSQSERYKHRLDKFKERCKLERNSGNEAYFDGVDGVDENKRYLFISNTGIPFFRKLSEINTRWNEVRKTASINLLNEIDAVVHNLRSTFAVSTFRALLKRGVDSEKALAMVSEFLGHEDIATTLLYLKIAEGEPTGDEIWEDILDYLGVFQEMEEEGVLDDLPLQTDLKTQAFEEPSS